MDTAPVDVSAPLPVQSAAEQRSNLDPQSRSGLHQEVFILVLSLFVLLLMAYELIFRPPADVVSLIRNFDNLICFVFLGDFALRFIKAPSKLRFMRWGWIDLLSSLPFLDQLRWGRAARVVRIMRLLRAFRSVRWVVVQLFRDRGKGAVLSAALITLVVMFSGALAILSLEGEEAGANIRTPGQALWWTLVTVTTVGYGDFYPTTNAGRIVGACLMVTGICLLAVITGAFASVFVSSKQDTATAAQPDHRSLEDLVAEVHALRLELGALHQHVALQKQEPPPSPAPTEPGN